MHTPPDHPYRIVGEHVPVHRRTATCRFVHLPGSVTKTPCQCDLVRRGRARTCKILQCFGHESGLTERAKNPRLESRLRGRSSVGRALASQARCRGFESHRPLPKRSTFVLGHAGAVDGSERQPQSTDVRLHAAPVVVAEPLAPTVRVFAARARFVFARQVPAGADRQPCALHRRTPFAPPPVSQRQVAAFGRSRQLAVQSCGHRVKRGQGDDGQRHATTEPAGLAVLLQHAIYNGAALTMAGSSPGGLCRR